MLPTPSHTGLRRLILLGFAGLFAVLGQVSFENSPPYILDGLLLYGVAVVLFHLAVRSREPSDRSLPAKLIARLSQNPWRTAAFTLSITLCVGLLRLLSRQPGPESYSTAWWLWVGSILAILASLGVLPRDGRGSLSQDSQGPNSRASGSRNLGTSWLVALFSLAFALRVWNLASIPSTLSGDEGSYGLEVARVVAGALRNPFVTGWSGTPTMGFFFVSPSLWFFGQDSLGLRFPWTIIGASTVLLAYFLATRFAGKLVGASTTIFLMTWGFHIHFSRIGLGNAADGFLAALAILWLYRALDTDSIRAWAATGGVVGLSLYVYTGGRIVPILIAVLALTASVRSPRSWLRHRAGLAALAAVALVVAAPMLQFAILHRDDFNARLNQVGIFQSGWVEREIAATGQGTASILADQLQRSVLAFNLYPDRDSFFGSTEPLLGFAAGIFFLVGLGYCTANAHRPRYLPMVAWWWAGLAGTVLTLNAPASQRMNILAIPSAFFIAVAIVSTCRLAAHSTRRPGAQRWAAACAITVTVILGVRSSWTYFTTYSQSQVYGNPNAVVATHLGRYAQRNLSPGTRVVFFGAPRMYVGFGSIPYLAPHVVREDVLEPLTEPLAVNLGCSEVGSAFVFLPERSNELAHVEASFPGGYLTEVTSNTSESPLFMIYQAQRPCGPSGAFAE